MSDPGSLVRVSDEACPRCGCHLVRAFACNCGAVHSDYCVNCGRFTSLCRMDYVELSELDVPCVEGAVPHVHAPEERAARLRAYMESVRSRAGRGTPS
jgi:hypothetical protein